jgi:hypothetical protein
VTRQPPLAIFDILHTWREGDLVFGSMRLVNSTAGAGPNLVAQSRVAQAAGVSSAIRLTGKSPNPGRTEPRQSRIQFRRPSSTDPIAFSARFLEKLPRRSATANCKAAPWRPPVKVLPTGQPTEAAIDWPKGWVLASPVSAVSGAISVFSSSLGWLHGQRTTRRACTGRARSRASVKQAHQFDHAPVRATVEAFAYYLGGR